MPPSDRSERPRMPGLEELGRVMRHRKHPFDEPAALAVGASGQRL
jgi:hypothetical protein